MKRSTAGDVVLLEPEDETDRRILERLAEEGVLDPGTRQQVRVPIRLDELVYSPHQPRDNKGRFGHGGGGGGVDVGVSRERPELGGGEIHSYGDLAAARSNPVIAAAERTTEADLEALGVDVASQRQVAGVFEGGGEPSLMLTLGRGSSVEDIEIGGAYMVRRNEQDSVITNVTGAEMDRLGLTPNGKLLKVTGLPTDAGSREAIFKDIQDKTPFASWDEKAGTVEVSYFDADLDRATSKALDAFAQSHSATLTVRPTHTRWYFHDEQTRAGAREYLHPSDPGVLRTPDEVIATYPGDRSAAIGPVRGGGVRPEVGGGGGAGEAGARWRDHDAGAGSAGLTPWAYSPGQKRDSVGRFGSGGGGGGSSPAPAGSTDGTVAPAGGKWVSGGAATTYPNGTERELTVDETKAALKEIGVQSDRIEDLDPVLRTSVVNGFADVETQHPELFHKVKVTVQVVQAKQDCYAEADLDGMENAFTKKAGYPEGDAGYATITLHSPRWQAGFGNKLKEDLVTDRIQGWHPPESSTPQGVIAHEMGHVFDAAVGGGRESMDLRPGRYGDMVRQNPHQAPSGYAKKNPGERFAEEFAAMTYGGKLSSATGTYVADLMQSNR